MPQWSMKNKTILDRDSITANNKLFKKDKAIDWSMTNYFLAAKKKYNIYQYGVTHLSAETQS